MVYPIWLEEAERNREARCRSKKELLDRLKQYKVGFCLNGQILMSKNMESLDGIFLVIPKNDFLELFGD